MELVSVLFPTLDAVGEMPARKRRLEREIRARPGQLVDPIEHDPAGRHRRPFGGEPRQAAGDLVGVDERGQAERVPEQGRGGGRFPRRPTSWVPRGPAITTTNGTCGL